MTVGSILAAIVVGLIIGALGRLVVPGKQDIPIWLTILIGIVAALIGTAIGAGTGALIGNDMQRRRRDFYWYNNRCWQRSSRGEFFPVANRYCR